MEEKEVSLELFALGAVRFGDFTLKSGMRSPIYVDLRMLVGNPELMQHVARAMAQALHGVRFDRLAGIAYAGIPLATALSLEMGKPMVYTRKEIKDYGTKKAIEGPFEKGETVVLVDDLITTASSKLEAAGPLREAGLQVRDVVVFLDRQQGGRQELEKHDMKLHACMDLERLLGHLKAEKKITAETAAAVKEFVARNRV